MTPESLESIMIVNYTHVFRELLLSLLKTDPELARTFLSQSARYQREVEAEVSEVSGEMARSLVRKLALRGHLETEPSDQDLHALVSDTLNEFRSTK